MSTQTLEPSLDIDLSALVGPMEPIPCEHSRHGEAPKFHNDGPATHYLRREDHCTGEPLVYAACGRWVAAVLMGNIASVCLDCGERGLGPEYLTVLGPVNK